VEGVVSAHTSRVLDFHYKPAPVVECMRETIAVGPDAIVDATMKLTGGSFDWLTA
jgi:hypothetical protein